jgi:hypothetical protein
MEIEDRRPIGAVESFDRPARDGPGKQPKEAAARRHVAADHPRKADR